MQARASQKGQSKGAAGQILTDKDHQSRLRYVFDDSSPTPPEAAELQQKAQDARRAVDDLGSQHACASCDRLALQCEMEICCIVSKPAASWSPLSGVEFDGEIPEILRDQYRLTKYATGAHAGWSSLLLSPLSIFEESGGAHIRLCFSCKNALSNNKIPKFSIRNRLWIGAFVSPL
jgi:hypothetical protein